MARRGNEGGGPKGPAGRTPRRPLAGLAGAVSVGVALAALLSGCSSGANTASEPTTATSGARAPGHATTSTLAPTTSTAAPTTTAPSPGPGPPPAIPASGAYLGAWINPAKGSAPGGSASAELAQLPAFRQAVGRTPAILSLYSAWDAPAPVGALEAITAAGAIPLLSWGCSSTAAIAAGQDDNLIDAYAQALKAFGHPVLLRWFWEMNLASIPKNAACLGGGGPASFLAAWSRIWTIFHEVGASNVAFVWCPGISSGLRRVARFFPGPSMVDWIGIDGYDRKGQGTTAISDLFGAWYQAYSGYGRPMIVAETGAPGAAQPAFLQGVGTTLPEFPQIKALVYFDAPGPSGAWQLTGPGLSAYGALASSSYFAPRP